MLELLNPTPLDIIRFAGQTLSFRHKVQRAHKTNPMAAYALAADRFLSPPDSARRAPTVERLRDDSKRYFGWSSKEWKQLEPDLEKLIANTERSQIKHLDETVQCYQWKAATKSPRGKMLLCHGWEGYAFNFAALITDAIEAGWEVFAFDHLAHANSGGKHSGLPIALSTLLAVAEHIGSVDIVVGHSLGGAAAAWATANKKIKAKKLVLLAPFYDTLQLTRMWAKAHFLNEDIRAGMQTELEKTTTLRFEDFMPPGLAKHFSLPVLIIHDPKDPITSFKLSHSLAALNKHVKLEPASNTGHVRLLADQVLIERVIKFCAEK